MTIALSIRCTSRHDLAADIVGLSLAKCSRVGGAARNQSASLRDEQPESKLRVRRAGSWQPSRSGGCGGRGRRRQWNASRRLGGGSGERSAPRLPGDAPGPGSERSVGSMRGRGGAIAAVADARLGRLLADRTVERCQKATIRHCPRIWLAQALACHKSAGCCDGKARKSCMMLVLTDVDNASRAEH